MQKVFWARGAKVSEKSFAPPKTAFAPVRNGVAPVQEALCSLGPKDPLHPPLSTFGNFPFSVNFPGPQLPNFRARKKHDNQKYCFDNPRPSYRAENLTNPKIGQQKYQGDIRTSPAPGDRRNTQKIPEKHPKIRFSYFGGIQGGI